VSIKQLNVEDKKNDDEIDGKVETDSISLTFKEVHSAKIIFREIRISQLCVRGWSMADRLDDKKWSFGEADRTQPFQFGKTHSQARIHGSRMRRREKAVRQKRRRPALIF
jgi:hypothetical protein